MENYIYIETKTQLNGNEIDLTRNEIGILALSFSFFCVGCMFIMFFLLLF